MRVVVWYLFLRSATVAIPKSIKRTRSPVPERVWSIRFSGFKIAMPDALLMRREEGVTHLLEDSRGAVERHTFGAHYRAESHAVYVLHHYGTVCRRERAAAVDGDYHAGMIDQHGERRGFLR